MLLKLFKNSKRKHLKMRVWRKRLRDQWERFAPNVSPWMNCSLQVSWGPVYNGAVRIDRRFRQAKVIIQIPYDGYVTSEEQKILSRFSISKNALPYFIFFHEVSHLLDIMPFIQTSDYDGLHAYLAAHRQMASLEIHYKDLPFEERADRFAYRMVMKNCRQAS